MPGKRGANYGDLPYHGQNKWLPAKWLIEYG